MLQALLAIILIDLSLSADNAVVLIFVLTRPRARIASGR